MKLYYSKGACSLSIRIIITEMGIDCDYESVNLADKKTEQGTDFYTINAKGSVPTLQLENGEYLTENVAILQYLAETYQATTLLPVIGNMQRYRVLEWLSFANSDLHKSFGPFFNKAMPEQVKADIFVPALKNKLNALERQLTGRDYITGENFTLPDAYIFVILRWVPVAHLALKDWPNVAAYFARLKERASIVAAMQAEGLA